MATTELFSSSPVMEQNLHLAFDDVVTELKTRLCRTLTTLVASTESMSQTSSLNVARLSEALSSELDQLVLQSVTACLLESQDGIAHLRRNALMRLLIEADAPVTVSDDARSNSLVISLDDKEMLTSEQAAKLLNVSRPHLNKLLDKGLIPGVERLEGGHRRISQGAVLRYKAEMKQRQIQASQEVSKLSQEMGLYDDELDGIPKAPKPQ